MADLVTREELAQYPVAMTPTRTFHPVPHIKLAERVITLACDILSGWTLLSETYKVAQDGAQCFSTLVFTRGDDGINFSVAWRNSTNKSLAIGICMGAQVICCSNLMFEGDIKILRKHSMNVWDDIETMAITSFYRHNHSYDKILSDVDRLKRKLISDDQAASMFGRLFYNGLLSPRQLPVAVKEWKEPTFTEFEPRTLYSLYNCSTHALKSESPASVLEKHTGLHSMIVDAEYRVL